MSDEFQRIEVITGVARRRRWSAQQKLQVVAEIETISTAAHQHGVAANLLYCWCRLIVCCRKVRATR